MFIKIAIKFTQAVFLSVAMLFCALSLAQSVNPKATHEFTNGKVIENRYIVTFRSNVANPVLEADNLMQGRGGQIHFRFNNAIKGFAATIPAAAINSIRNNPNVESVELDAEVNLNQVASPQNQVTWGLDRVDQRDRPLDTQYYFQNNGSVVTAFVIDTGIRSDHVEFVGRVAPGYTAVGDGYGTNDCNGHGTHVAGTIGGTTWGVAKAVKLVPVRVLDCAGSGTLSGVIAGIDWVAGSTARPAVANLSLGSSKSSTVNAAVAGAYNKGVTMVVAAGNSNADACLYSPSSEPTAITVGATTSSDARASFSNYGSCVDIFAPGSSITSAWYTSATATNTISGTSMASPHVAGIAALALSASPSANPSAVTQFILSNSSFNKLSSVGTGSPNKLSYSMASGGPGIIQVQTVAIKSLTGSAKKSGKTWQATVAVTVRDINTGANVSNASVTGSFSPGAAAGCTTSSNGSCTMSSGSIATSSKLTTYAVTGLSGNNMSYDATQNAATQITVALP